MKKNVAYLCSHVNLIVNEIKSKSFASVYEENLHLHVHLHVSIEWLLIFRCLLLECNLMEVNIRHHFGSGACKWQDHFMDKLKKLTLRWTQNDSYLMGFQDVKNPEFERISYYVVQRHGLDARTALQSWTQTTWCFVEKSMTKLY